MSSTMDKLKVPEAPPSYDSPPPYCITKEPSSSTTVVVPVDPPLGRTSAHVVCSSCRILVATRLELKPTAKTHIFAVLCFPLACWAYCLGAFYTVNHICPNCDKQLGTYQTKCCDSGATGT